MALYPEGRFYEAEFPEVEEIVMVQVVRIVEMGAYVTLLEYDGREGMMLLSELSKRRIRSVSKLLRVGRIEVCLVLRVDKEKGYIDLSKRRVAPEDATAKEEAFARAKTIHGIMRHVASNSEIDVIDLCGKICWPLYKKYQDAYEAFRRHSSGDINVWEELDFSSPGEDLTDKKEKIIAVIEQDLRRKLVQQMQRVRAKVEVSCSEYEGIDAIREALTKGFEASKEDCEIKIKLIAHPLFVLTCMCRDKVLGLATVDEAVQKIKESIEASKGVFDLKVKPEIVGEKEDQDERGSSGDQAGSGTDSDSTDSDADDEPQDVTMGNIDEEALEALKKKTADVKDEDDDDDDK